MKRLFFRLITLSALLAGYLLTFFPQTAAAQYVVSNLVSNDSAFAPVNTDPNLVDGWGLASFADGPWWVANQNSSSSTLYTSDGSIAPLIVQIPCVVSGTITVPCPLPGEGLLFEPNNGMFNFFGPTGVVANSSSSAFVIPGTGAPAAFIFDTLDGLIVGWNSANPTQGIVVANRNSLLASYSGDLGFGSGIAGNGATNQLFFSAGPCPPASGTCPAQLYGDGLFGVITPTKRR